MSKSKFNPKSDHGLAEEVKDILDAYVEKAAELHARGLAVNFTITNGMDGNPPRIHALEVVKRIVMVEPPKPEAQPAAQPGQPVIPMLPPGAPRR